MDEVEIMKIYTKTGDSGKTSLASGKRVSKSDPSVELYGTCDELNSSIGVCLSFLNLDSKLKEPLTIIQNLLFDLGAELAGYRKEGKADSALLPDDINYLEKKIDEFQEELEQLRNFILPGGSKPASFLHISRTICRRLERNMVKAQDEGIDIFKENIILINRLSDFLFVAARFANKEEGVTDIKWISRAKS